jgi:uncharacterized protein (TIGR03000 family)
MLERRGAWALRALAVTTLSLAAAPADPGTAGAPPGEESAAQITVSVPEGAEVWFEGRKTAQQGPTRHFITPPLAPERWYTYHLEVRYPGAGSTAVRAQTLTVRAGNCVNLDCSTVAEAKGGPGGLTDLPVVEPPPVRQTPPQAELSATQVLVPPIRPPSPTSRALSYRPERSEDPGTSDHPSPPSPPGPSLSPPSTTAHFGHDPNYHWLVGTLDYSQIQRAWLVRYAPQREEDRHGGCVTLQGLGSMNNFHSGQRVLVEGRLVDEESEKIRPPYRVESIRALEQP